ncbi:hypothetical protein K458DRAFT_445544 [Lentithecium fluviatile CBS 122367]|uniref:Uncharacterized protein n=1 Tax=Lentithecium fluviatile CBS 122367 TaxID=1168545 RepID=A0A6G1IPD1_9PLEO|nr:hypothetical protein K458DRAFT_445544 [Lentithecium fluviatile CBS 122367]
MASIQEKLKLAATRNAELLEALHALDSAPFQLYQQIQYLDDLETQRKKTVTRVDGLKKITQSELNDHKKYSESAFRRFAYKASGRNLKFVEQAAKEEREYFDAIQQQKAAEDKLGYIMKLKAEGETTMHRYEAQAQHHDQLQRDLQILYNSIFAGPTPGFPGEDQKEAACQAANQHVQAVNAALQKQERILFALRQISTKLGETRGHLRDAHMVSQMDLFHGEPEAVTQKRNGLERAESSISQVRMLQQQLQQIAPQLYLGPMNITSGGMWGDVVFDNVFSDMDFRDKIKASEAQIGRAWERCAELESEQEGRRRELVMELKQADARIGEARVELQKAREDAFRRVLGGEQIPGAGELAADAVAGTPTTPRGIAVNFVEDPPAYRA